MTEHVAIPWRFRMMGSEGARIMPNTGNIREDGKYIARVDGRDFHTDQANAEFIIRAVNAHQALVDALQKQQAYLNYLRREVPTERFNIDDQAKTVNAALALARGESADPKAVKP